MQAQSQDFLPSASMNTTDYESTGYQSNPSISGNLNSMNGHLNPPIYNQVEAHTNDSYPSHGSSVYRSDMTNNGPTDNHFQHVRTINNRFISYIITPIPMQESLSFNSPNVMNKSTNPRYFLVKKLEETQSVMSAADIGEMLAS